MNPIYIADHLLPMEGEHQGHPDRIADSLRRIADHADLFEPMPDSLTPSQQQQVQGFIQQFRTTTEGQAALVQVKQAIAGGYRRLHAKGVTRV
ncbi:hypothetical protein H6F78_00090 [Coleofasciculus sp. FACHB-64]|uniref:hypothetical protein n=1 Tax=Cyanophyceae TaxID=3028117 RepID=UPI001687B282|nr:MULTISPECIES: hypothetical protein [unclassified Coleofasciculus]MBD1840856.1 hypothetical protein [Coleofasciculus sp. FACHB-501]MBD1893169.1 hypothetical protein [Coleofasciculus sp. FACHB-129]MBD2044046.1 hypothetical protein [Coleofasciculus sp. FACHB-64]